MDAVTLITKGVERWNAHDREGFIAFYDEAIEFVDRTTGQKLVGREEFGKGFFDLWTDAYPDCRIEKPLVFASGELVCLEAVFVGTNTGPFRGPQGELPPTGKRIEGPFVFIGEVRGDKVKVARHYYDRLLALEQEGIVDLEQLLAATPTPH